MSDSTEKLQQIHLKYDGEKDGGVDETLSGVFEEETDFLKTLGDEIRRDTKEMEQQISFPNMTANIMNGIESEDSLWFFILEYFRKNKLAVAGISACFLVMALAFMADRFVGDSNKQKAAVSDSNECIIETIENKNGTSLVLKEEAEDPVTIIWVFEDSDSGKM